MLVHRGTDAYVTRPVSSLLWGTSADITYSFAAVGGTPPATRHCHLIAGIIGQLDFNKRQINSDPLKTPSISITSVDDN